MEITKFKVKNRIITRENDLKLIGMVGQDKFEVDFVDEAWTGLHKTMKLVREDGKVYYFAMVNDEVTLTQECYVEGVAKLGFFGTINENDPEELEIASTDYISIYFAPHAYSTDSGEPINTPTPTQWDIIIGQMNDVKEQIDVLAEQVHNDKEYVAEVKEEIEQAEIDIDEYNRNHEEKMQEYNENASSKMQAYNENATTKTQNFNDNADSKTTSFNNNYNTKLNAINTAGNIQVNNVNQAGTTQVSNINTAGATAVTNIQSAESTALNNIETAEEEAIENIQLEASSYDTRITELEQANARLRSNFDRNTPTPSDNLTIEDAINDVVDLYSPIGKTSQKSYTGKNLFTGDFSQFNNQGGEGSTYAYFKLPDDNESYTLTLIAKNDFTPNIYQYIGFSTNGGNADKPYHWVVAGANTPTISKGTVLSYSTSSFRFISLFSNSAQTLKIFTDNFDIILEKAPAFTSYEPYVGGTASPNPDYPQTIENVNGDVKIDSSNGNLLDEKELLNANYSTGIYKYTNINNLPRNVSLYCQARLKAGKNIISGLYVFITNNGNNPNQAARNKQLIGNGRVLLKGEVTFITTDTISFAFYPTNANISDILDTYSFEVSLLQNQDYIEHQGQSITFPLAEGQKLMQGDYLAEDGIHHLRSQKVLDGTENWDTRTAQNTEDTYYLISTILDPIAKINSNIKCNIASQGAVYGVDVPNRIALESLSPKLRIRMSTNLVDSVSDWTTYLATQYTNGTPIILEYDLLSETIEPYTSEQQTAWNELQKLETYKDCTHIYTSSDGLAPDSKVTYLVNPFASIEARLDLLEN